jgi:YVTN family beta-propeller protein
MTAAGSDGDQRLEFGILGPLEVLRSGTRLKLGGRQQRAILGLLLCEAGQVVSIGRLADALWGEHLPTGFLTTVQTYIFHLRALLEPDRARGAGNGVLVTEAGGGYRLHAPAGAVDGVLFEDLLVRGQAALERQDPAEAVVLLDRALGLWRGEVLGDLADFGFVAPVAGRLQELRLSAMELRMEAELALGHHGTAVAELDRLVADHPLREQLHAERILALYRSGRQSEALAAYRQLRATLQEDLGIEPSPPLNALHSAVLAQDPALAWQPTALAPVAAVGGGIGTKEGFAGGATLAPPSLGGDYVVRPSLGGQAGVRPGGFLSTFGGGSRRRLVALWAAAVLVATGGSIGSVVWLARSTSPVTLAANSVGAVDPDGSISAAVPVGTDPAGLAFGGGALWAANRSDGTVSRIDLATHTVVQTIDVGTAPEALTVTAGSVWVANFSDNTVSQINIATNKTVETITVGTRPAAISSGHSGVWVANSGDNTIQRINPITGLPDKPIGVGDGPDGIAVDADSVWVANGRDGTVSWIDPKTGQDVTSPIRAGSGPKGIAVSGNDVWVANELAQDMTRINRSTGVASSIVVGDGPRSVVVAGGAVWVSEEFKGVLTRIDQATDAVQRFSIGSSPRGLAAVGGRVWVAAGAFADQKHSGGTLTVAATPAELDTFSAERLVYDGLVAFRLASGADSQTLVPDLAFRIPQPSNGGRTYTFTLRPGIKYSTGRDVHASDFVLGVRRALTLKDGRPDFFTGIIGGQNCEDHPAACDLSRGVVTDNTTGRVTFHLSKPDPEFTYKLAGYVHPAPPGTSPKEVTNPVPGTGPYRITDYAEGKRLNLVRNRWFHQWSVAAQPAGYPDVIRWLVTTDTRASLAAVISGRADVAQPLPSKLQTSPALVSEFKVRYPGQVKSEGNFGPVFEDLNVAVPPFNNLKARQAVSYAVDRNKLVAVFGGPSVAVPTCQLLPPKFPGYSPYCPYTTGPADGRYHGPDFAKARKLVDESGTKGMSVTIHTRLDGAFPTVNAYFKQVLGQLGYKVTLHQMPYTTATDQTATDDFLSNPHNHVQVQMYGWIPDFPLASDFYDAVVACGAVTNLSQYCNRGLDQRAATATALRATDPGEALRAWTQIYRTISDEALVVPIFNPIASTFVSARVGNYQSNQTLGPLLSQLWVR